MQKQVQILILSTSLFGLFSCAEPLTVEPEVSVIAFGSCDHQNNPNKLWAEIIAHKPDVFIWGGDIMYGDSPNMDTLVFKYQKQKSLAGYQTLMQNTKITGIYDDHDYGINDGGKYFAQKAESKILLFNFLDIPETNEAYNREGAYHAVSYGSADKKVKVINLDTRYFRDTIYRDYRENLETGSTESYYKTNLDGDILGDAQWQWLENELTNSDAAFHILNSSIQVVSSEHRFEKWANFPKAQEKLYNLIAKTAPKGLFIISGDRHIAELSKIDLPNLPYPLYDFTSSGLTHTWRKPWPEANKNRVGDLVIKKNFGLIFIDWESKKLTFEVRGQQDSLFLKETVKLY